MKIEGVKEKITAMVKIGEKYTGKNLTLPVLSCLFFEAKEGELLIRATNLEVGFEVRIPVKIKEEGKAAVPASVLSNFLQSLSGDKNIQLEVREGNVFVSGSKTNALIKSLPTDDFPTIPHLISDKKIKIEAKDFVRGLKAVSYSSAVSAMKPELSSVYMYSDQDYLIFVATDSFRLAEKKIRIKNTKDVEAVLIPAKNISQLIGALESINDSIEVTMGANQISFSYNGLYITSRTVDGTFPDYHQIIPKEFKTDVVVLKQDFADSLKRANIFSDTFNQINIKADPQKKEFIVKTKNGQLGENSNSLDAVVKGEPIEIHFNYKYINDSFQSIEADSVTVGFSGMHRPMVMRGVSDNSFTYLVMPMNK